VFEGDGTSRGGARRLGVWLGVWDRSGVEPYVEGGAGYVEQEKVIVKRDGSFFLLSSPPRGFMFFFFSLLVLVSFVATRYFCFEVCWLGPGVERLLYKDGRFLLHC